MAEAVKLIVLVDYLTQMVRVYSNAPNLMVEVDETLPDDPEGERSLELIKREYPYLNFGEEPDDSDN